MSNEKDTNPKEAVGIRKVAMSCLSSPVVALVAQAYQANGFNPQKSILASHHCNLAINYLMGFWEGIRDSAYPPALAQAMAHVMMIRDAQLGGRLLDDRKKSAGGLHVSELNTNAADIIAKYLECKPPFTHLHGSPIGSRLVLDREYETPYHVLPWRVVMEAALGMMEGARKYGRHNYRKMGVRASVYYDAGCRHLLDFIEGTDVDKDSGLSHLAKFLSCISVLLDCQLMGNWVDDRPIRIPLRHAQESDTLATKDCRDIIEKRAVRLRTGQILPGEHTCAKWKSIDSNPPYYSLGVCPTCQHQVNHLCPGPLCLSCDKQETCAKMNYEDPIEHCTEWTSRD